MSWSTDGWCPRRLRGRRRSVHVGDERRFSSLRQPEQSWRSRAALRRERRELSDPDRSRLWNTLFAVPSCFHFSKRGA